VPTPPTPDTETVRDPDPGRGGGLDPYDAVLLLSFGGPEKPDEVLPFLENVTRGRGVPRERLVEVAEHYQHFGGRSPINDQNRALLAALRAELAGRGVATPVFWGNRNWAPYVTDALREAHESGARRVLALVTSAYPSYSGCRQYREDLAGAIVDLAAEGRQVAVDKVRHYGDHPGFVVPAVDAVDAALTELEGITGEYGRVVFVTHSIPVAMDETAGPRGGGYTAMHRDVCEAVAARVADRRGREIAWDLVYCSRSGPPQQRWLEPDVNDHLEDLSARGVSGVVVAPVGFVSDHMEVVFDLDTEALATAEKLELPYVRAATAGTDPRFVAGLADLLAERAATERGEHPDRPATGRLGPWHDVCPVGCCPNLRVEKPAAAGADWPPAEDAVPGRGAGEGGATGAGAAGAAAVRPPVARARS
jgi:ferrochelatase